MNVSKQVIRQTLSLPASVRQTSSQHGKEPASECQPSDRRARGRGDRDEEAKAAGVSSRLL